MIVESTQQVVQHLGLLARSRPGDHDELVSLQRFLKEHRHGATVFCRIAFFSSWIQPRHDCCFSLQETRALATTEEWLKEIREGRAGALKPGPAMVPKSREVHVAARLSDLNTRQMLLNMRTEAGLTQAEVAKRLGTSRPAVSQHENKPIASMTVGTLAKYAHACGYRFDPGKAIEKITPEDPEPARSSS